MPYLVNQLITDAFFESGILSRDFQTITGSQQAAAFQSLNDIIQDTNIETDVIPTYTVYNFNLPVNTETTFIQGLFDASTFTFFIGNVRYQTRKMYRDRYFGESRANNIDSLPFSWHLLRSQQVVNGVMQYGSTLYTYFFPNIAYPAQIVGLFGLFPVSLNQDLTQTFDTYYINYLRFRLAERLCFKYNFEVPIGVEKQMLRYMQAISKKSGPMDLEMRKISTLNNGSTLNYGQVNLGQGWGTN